MIAVAWRQHRVQILVVVAMAGALIGWMIVVGHAVPIALQNGAKCTENWAGGGFITSQCDALLGEQTILSTQTGIIYDALFIVPMLTGLVIGSSLVAGDLQRRTNRFAWTQSVSRTRWYLTKSALVAAVAVVSSVAVAAVAAWWVSIVTTETSNASHYWSVQLQSPEWGSRIHPALFDVTGYVVVAYALFALALGVTFGAVFRKTFWSVLATIVIFVTVRLVIIFLRPFYLTPLSAPDASFQQYGLPTSDWIVGDSLRNLPGGHANPHQLQAIANACSEVSSNSPESSYFSCLTVHHAMSYTLYQPLSRFWEFQAIESGIFVAAAIALFGLGLWAVRRWRA